MNKHITSSMIIAALAFLFSAPAYSELDQTKEETTMTTVGVRYIVDGVDAAISFYTGHLGFSVGIKRSPGFAMLSRGNLRLLLNAPGAGGAGQALPDGRKPAPGGWNRIQIEVANLSDKVESLRKAGASFRNDIISGYGGRQILLEDPAGNPIELLEPAKAQ
jgi:catechol 2,3-dioxygenase-like lactoylglutathione lyase family enzyme